MKLLTEFINVLGAVLLQIAIGLLIEELTFAGLVRLIFAPRPTTRKTRERNYQVKGEK